MRELRDCAPASLKLVRVAVASEPSPEFALEVAETLGEMLEELPDENLRRIEAMKLDEGYQVTPARQMAGGKVICESAA